jgi:hypothetical protein
MGGEDLFGDGVFLRRFGLAGREDEEGEEKGEEGFSEHERVKRLDG